MNEATHDSTFLNSAKETLKSAVKAAQSAPRHVAAATAHPPHIQLLIASGCCSEFRGLPCSPRRLLNRLGLPCFETRSCRHARYDVRDVEHGSRSSSPEPLMLGRSQGIVTAQV